MGDRKGSVRKCVGLGCARVLCLGGGRPVPVLWARCVAALVGGPLALAWAPGALHGRVCVPCSCVCSRL